MALRPLAAEDITVSSSAIGFTAANIPPTNTKVVLARVQHKSGGNAWYRSDADPVTAGNAGEFDFRQFDEIEVWGDKALNTTKWIKQSGESDATLAVQYFGEG